MKAPFDILADLVGEEMANKMVVLGTQLLEVEKVDEEIAATAE